MSFTPVQQLSLKLIDSVTGASTFTMPANFTAGNSCVVSLAVFNSAITSVVVNGVTATRKSSSTATSAHSATHAEIWIAEGLPGGGNTVVVTPNGAGQFVCLGAVECAGLAPSSSFDVQAVNTPTNTAAPSVTSPALAQSQEVAFAAMAGETGNVVTITQPSGWTAMFAELDGANHQVGAGAFLNLTSRGTTAAVTATWGYTDSDPAQQTTAAIATFKIAVAGSGIGAKSPLITPPGTFNQRLPPFWPPGRETQLSSKSAAAVQPSVSVAPLSLALSFAAVATRASGRVGLALPSPTLPGEFNRFLPPFWPPGREALLSTKVAAAQSSVAVTGLALTLAGQAIKGRNAALVAPAALVLGLSAVKGQEAAKLSVLPLTLAGQAVKGREAAVTAPLALTLTGQAVKGREAAIVSPEALALGGGSTKAQAAAKLAPEVLSLSFAVVKGRQGAAAGALPLVLGGGATKVKLTAAIARLPLALTFANVNTATGGNSSVIVSPMLLSFAGNGVKAQLAAKLAPEALVLGGGAVHGGRGAAAQRLQLGLATGAVKGRQSAAAQPLPLSLDGGATKAKLTAAMVRLPLTLAFGNVSTQASGGATLAVAPLLVAIAGQAVKGQLLVRIAPLAITEIWSNVRLPGDVVFVALPGRVAFASPRRRVDMARTRSST